MADQATQLAAQLDGDDVVRGRAAAESLAALGEDAAPAAVPLVHAAAHADDELREYAVAALEELGSPPADDATELAKLLRAEHSDSAYWAATLLGRLGEDAAASANLLASVLIDESCPLSVRQRCAWALGRIGTAEDSVADALRKVAANKDVRLARLAKASLESIADARS